MNKLLSKLTHALTALVLLVATVTMTTAHSAEVDDMVFFQNDHLGSAIVAVNEYGDLCWSETYTPFGDKILDEDIGFGMPDGCGLLGQERGYTSHTEDVESGLTYMQQRFYDPTMGRFLSVDPMDVDPFDTGTLNRYSYARNNPHKYIDPDGRESLATWGLNSITPTPSYNYTVSPQDQKFYDAVSATAEPASTASNILGAASVMTLATPTTAPASPVLAGASTGLGIWSTVVKSETPGRDIVKNAAIDRLGGKVIKPVSNKAYDFWGNTLYGPEAIDTMTGGIEYTITTPLKSSTDNNRNDGNGGEQTNEGFWSNAWSTVTSWFSGSD